MTASHGVGAVDTVSVRTRPLIGMGGHLIVMVRLGRATRDSTVPPQVARTSRTMTIGNNGQ